MEKPLVSICIPTHNRLEFLKQSLQSALDQTYDNIEIVISDNSDNDKTKNYIRSLRNPRISYYYCPDKATSFLNLHNVVHRAKGEYIKFLLDDDLLATNCVEEMIKPFVKHPLIGVVMAPLNIIDINGNSATPHFYIFRKMKTLYRYKTQNKYVSKEEILNDFLTRVYPCSVPTGFMFKKSLYDELGKPDPYFRYIVDIDLCMSFATKMDFYYIDKFLSSWRYTSSSETISILHTKGSQTDIFYKLTDKYIRYAESKRKALFFASKRTTLNIIAGLRSKNIPLIIETIKTILYNDPYILNKLYLPFDILFEVLKSFNPYEKKR